MKLKTFPIIKKRNHHFRIIKPPKTNSIGPLRTDKSIYDSFQIGKNMIVVTILLLIMNRLLWTKWTSVSFITNWKNVATIIFLLIWKESQISFRVVTEIGFSSSFRLEKYTSAERETCVSRHNGGPIKGPLKPLNTIVLWCSKGFQDGPQFNPHDPDRR